MSRGGGLNLFLTGEIQVGKSTLLRNVTGELGLRSGGFRTRPAFNAKGVCAYLLEPFGAEGPSIPMARRTGEGFRALPVTFDGLGCSLLRKALTDRSDLIVMDEIGFFESRAEAFHDSVMACLNSPKIVLGVLKKSDALLPRRVRSRDDVRIVDVTLENRDDLFPALKRLIAKEI